MKIGILLTDHVMDELKAKHGDMDDFYKYIFNKVDPTIELETVSYTHLTLPTILLV